MAKYSIVKLNGKWYLGRDAYGFRQDEHLWECSSHAEAVREMVRADSIQGSSHCATMEKASHWGEWIDG